MHIVSLTAMDGQFSTTLYSLAFRGPFYRFLPRIKIQSTAKIKYILSKNK